MLNRQKIILHLVMKADRPVSSTILFKLAFLLRHETAIKQDPVFYDFVPYKFGPYSFALQRELETLRAYGYLNSEEASAAVKFSLGTATFPQKVSEIADKAVQFILGKYGDLSQQMLLKDVYARYSWYATNTELKDLVANTTPKIANTTSAVYTIGYRRMSVDHFVNYLLLKGMRTVFDVRANPISRKYGFARSSLKAICRKVGIAYEHFPNLGIPSRKRKNLEEEGALVKLFDYYERHILAENETEITNLAEKTKRTAGVLLCAEENPEECHRSRLANAISLRTGLPIVNL